MEHTLCWLFFLAVHTCVTTDETLTSCRYYETRKEMACSDSDLRELKARKYPVNESLTISLQLRNTKLTSLIFDVFDYLTNLEYLDLSENLLQYLDERLFEKQKSLLELNLSYNRLSNFPEKLFTNLRELRNLNLDSNLIIFINNTRIFESQSNLHYLSLKYNKLISINPEVVVPLLSLKRLGLTGNPFNCDCNLRLLMLWCEQKCIETGALCQSPLELNGKPWTILRKETCNTYSNQMYIKLLRIKNIVQDPNYCDDKKCFYVSKNHLTYCRDAHLGNIKANEYPLLITDINGINLRNTGLKEIEPGTFDKLTDLYFLDLGENMIENINSSLFSKLIKLEELYLDFNRLFTLTDERLFSAQINLEVLSLRYNRLTYISVKVLESLVSLNTLSLDSNSFNCDYLLRPTVLWSEKRGIRTGATCKSPEEYAGISWESLRHSTSYFVTNMSTTDITLIVVAVLGGLLVLSCIFIACWMLWKRLRLDPDPMGSEEERNYVRPEDGYYETIVETRNPRIYLELCPTIPEHPNSESHAVKNSNKNTSSNIYDDVGIERYSTCSKGSRVPTT